MQLRGLLRRLDRVCLCYVLPAAVLILMLSSATYKLPGYAKSSILEKHSIGHDYASSSDHGTIMDRNKTSKSMMTPVAKSSPKQSMKTMINTTSNSNSTSTIRMVSTKVISRPNYTTVSPNQSATNNSQMKNTDIKSPIVSPRVQNKTVEKLSVAPVKIIQITMSFIKNTTKSPAKTVIGDNSGQNKLRRDSEKGLASSPLEVDQEAYGEALSAHASADKIILLALIDSSFLDMALNFYETSIKKFSITNILFIASDMAACKKLEPQNIPCYVYMSDRNAKKSTVYGTDAFKHKMNIRTYMILDAVEKGFTVLHSDVDIVFMKNPFDYIKCSGECDIAILWDDTEYNAGFLYVRPTNNSKFIYTKMKHIALSTKLDDQRALNNAIQSTNHQLISHIVKLPKNQFLCGLHYFEKGKRYFAGDNPCEKCIVIHNNWITTKEAKRYRFQELHMWMYDRGYYNNSNTKFITYSNTKVLLDKMTELEALKNALYLGRLLNRTVILPRFHCDKEKIHQCPLNSYLNMAKFDQKFGGKYRESTFLSHPRVPSSIRSGQSAIHWIWTDTAQQVLGGFPKTPNSTLVLLQPLHSATGPTRSELLRWFASQTQPLLRFHSLYGLFGGAFQPADNKLIHFSEDVKKSFLFDNYRQLGKKVPVWE